MLQVKMCYFNMVESLWHLCLPEGFDMQHIFWCATAAAVSFLIESTIIIYGNGHRGDAHIGGLQNFLS